MTDSSAHPAYLDELRTFITSPGSPIIDLFLSTGYLGWFCNQRAQLYNVSWMSNFQYSSAYSQSHFGPRLQRSERVISLVVKLWKHVVNSSKAVCSKKWDRRKQMARELFRDSSKILLPSALLTKFWLEKLTNNKSSAASQFHFATFYLCSFLTFPVRILSVEQMTSKLLKNFSQDSNQNSAT